jgi:hypothetical protein
MAPCCQSWSNNQNWQSPGCQEKISFVRDFDTFTMVHCSSRDFCLFDTLKMLFVLYLASKSNALAGQWCLHCSIALCTVMHSCERDLFLDIVVIDHISSFVLTVDPGKSSLATSLVRCLDTGCGRITEKTTLRHQVSKKSDQKGSHLSPCAPFWRLPG